MVDTEITFDESLDQVIVEMVVELSDVRLLNAIGVWLWHRAFSLVKWEVNRSRLLITNKAGDTQAESLGASASAARPE